MKLSDYIVGKLIEWGAEDAFIVVGGSAMHLNDSLAKSSLRLTCFHHEQAASMAAECYARVKGKPGILCVTSGPGAINALNGVFGAYTDSVPMFVLSGQVKRETMNPGGLRQLGNQEAPTLRFAEAITKYAVCLQIPGVAAFHLERAWEVAISGRPGPVWLDIPVDVQAAEIECS